VTPIDCDVCVVGAGPAGCVAALRLASWGHSVCLIERQRFPRPHVGESLSPGAWTLLDSIGVARPTFAGAMLPARDTHLCWAESDPRVVSSRGTGGAAMVDRAEFDRVLLETTRAAGVRVVQPAVARVRRDGSSFCIEARGDAAATIRAARLIDASGRRGCLPGARLRFAPMTVALWTRAEATSDQNTRIEALTDGWLWSAVDSERTRSVMLFCEPASVQGRTGASLEQRLRAGLATSRLWESEARALFIREVTLLDATCNYAVPCIGDGYLKVGEASYRLDPLSSAGVEKAIQTAIVGAVVTNTLLRDPAMAVACARFYEDRQREAVAAHGRWAEDHYRDVVRFAEEPFWAARRGMDAGAPRPELTAPPDRAPPLGSAHVRMSPDAALRDEPCIVGDCIDVRRALHAPGLSRPLAFVDGVAIAPLLEVLDARPTWRSLISAWSEHVPAVTAERVAAWLWTRRVVSEVSEVSEAI
jgi:flavin-dependent dehydrogenase